MAETELIKLWTPHEKQREMIDDPHRFKVAVIGRRFGKTTAAVHYMLEEALLKKDGLYYYISPSYKMSKQIAWDMLAKAIRKLPKELVTKVNETELSVVIGNGSKIVLKGAEDPDSLRGVGLDGVVIDEYADIRENVFTEIIRPALADKIGWAIVMGTPRGFNHFHRLYVQASTDPEWGVFKFTSFQNPLLNRDELESIRLKTPEDTFAQEYLAEFKRFEGLVYKEFRREDHTFAELPERQFINVIAGVDWGYTNNSAIVVIGQDFDNHYWIVDEYYRTGKTTAELIEVMKGLMSRWHITQFYPDPAEPDRLLEMERSGLSVREVSKDIEAGIDRVRELFKSNRLKVHAGCTNLLFELESYRYPPKRDGVNEKETPVKEHDHALDAIRYALFSNTPIDVREDANFNMYGSTYN